jgi:hypothetical protein
VGSQDTSRVIDPKERKKRMTNSGGKTTDTQKVSGKRSGETGETTGMYDRVCVGLERLGDHVTRGTKA